MPWREPKREPSSLLEWQSREEEDKVKWSDLFQSLLAHNSLMADLGLMQKMQEIYLKTTAELSEDVAKFPNENAPNSQMSQKIFPHSFPRSSQLFPFSTISFRQSEGKSWKGEISDVFL